MRDETEARAVTLYLGEQEAVCRRTDRLFATLLIFEWLAGIVAALLISPLAWAGSASRPHVHLWAAVFLGGAVVSLPVALAVLQPGKALTRHVIAVAQMFFSGLLIHLTGGRIETHFHIFGSLAFLAFYRDWRVLVTASVVTALDHFVRGYFWPRSIFGVLTASPCRPLEHAGWVVFEDIFLIRSCLQGAAEMWDIARRQARLEAVNSGLRSLVERVRQTSVALTTTATEVAAAARQQEQTVHDHADSTGEVAAAVTEITATSGELLRTVEEVNRSAGHAAELAAASQEGLASLQRVMTQLADSVAAFGAKLADISERAADISLVVTTIAKVADQTNLLSVNAAIEAEKAGEAGRGFLVVARVVRRLSDQTDSATRDIERIVRDTKASIAAGVMEMDRFSQEVRHSVEDVGRIGGTLGETIHAVQELIPRFEHVNEGMKAQAQGADQIRSAIGRLSAGVARTVESLGDFNKATTDLRQVVDGLLDEVSQIGLAPADGPAAAEDREEDQPTFSPQHVHSRNSPTAGSLPREGQEAGLLTATDGARGEARFTA